MIYAVLTVAITLERARSQSRDELESRCAVLYEACIRLGCVGVKAKCTLVGDAGRKLGF